MTTILAEERAIIRCSGRDPITNLAVKDCQITLPPKQSFGACGAFLPELPVGRVSGASAQSHGKIYNCGGKDLDTKADTSKELLSTTCPQKHLI